ncbi:hypothetical protein [Streptomyces flavidovirens]|uniref:hypothetical protein n=1 Tax=Streptomyces flavidovirens TaxID=67298 RepID=UPI003693C8B8
MEIYTPSENERIKHLEFIQSTISRLGNNSFLIRGWAVTVTGVLIAISVQSAEWRVASVALGLSVGFWALDSSYLRRERMFRRLYEDAAQRPSTQVPLFSMNTQQYETAVKWNAVLFSGSTIMVHLPIISVDAFISVLLLT